MLNVIWRKSCRGWKIISMLSEMHKNSSHFQGKTKYHNRNTNLVGNWTFAFRSRRNGRWRCLVAPIWSHRFPLDLHLYAWSQYYVRAGRLPALEMNTAPLKLSSTLLNTHCFLLKIFLYYQITMGNMNFWYDHD